jgi:DNA polymerase III epsilon subunit-like protein
MKSNINSVVVFDCETGGLDSAPDPKDKTINPITQIALQSFELTDFKEINRYQDYVLPYDNPVYDDKALAYTGITLQLLHLKGKQIKEVVKNLCSKFEEANTARSKIKKPILLGHNILFDIGFLQYAFYFCKVDLSKYIQVQERGYNKGMPVFFDTMWMMRQRFAGEDIKYNLGECCRIMGVDLTDAHDAMNDVTATKELFVKLVRGMRSDGGEETQKQQKQRIKFQF